MPADQFLAHELNARRHPGQQREALRSSLNAVGWIAPVIVSKRTGKLLDGHARIEEALTKDEAGLVPFVSVDVDEAEEALILGTFDPITNQATYDREALDGLLRQIETSESGLQQLLADLAAKNDLYLTDEKGAGSEPQDAEPQIDKAAELNKKWKVKTGDLWLIGDHRLLCGDSTKAEDVARVMDGERAALCLTDPPYGIGIAANPVRQKFEKDDWDNKPATPEAIQMCVGSAPAVIVWGGNYFDLPATQGFFVWDKKQPEDFSLAMCEMAWTNIKTPAKMYRESVTSYAKDHPTQKPVGLFAWCMEYAEGDVFDPFCGSGTTMVAAQNLNRKCYAMEISPNYCAVILERMATAFPSLDIRRGG